MIAKVDMFDDDGDSKCVQSQELTKLKGRLIELGQYNEEEFSKIENEVRKDLERSSGDKMDTIYYVKTLPWLNAMLTLSELPGFDFSRLKNAGNYFEIVACTKSFPDALKLCNDYSKIDNWKNIMQKAPELIDRVSEVTGDCNVWIENELDKKLLFYDEDVLRILRKGELQPHNVGRLSAKAKQLSLIAHFFGLDVKPLGELPDISDVLKRVLDIPDCVWHSQSEMLQEVSIFIEFVKSGCKQNFTKYNSLDYAVYRALGIQRWPEMYRKTPLKAFKVIRRNDRMLCINQDRVRLYSDEIQDYIFDDVNENTIFEISKSDFSSIIISEGYNNPDSTVHPILPGIEDIITEVYDAGSLLEQMKIWYQTSFELTGIFDWAVGYCSMKFPNYSSFIKEVCQYCKENKCNYLLDTMCYVLCNCDDFMKSMIEEFGLLDITKYAALYYDGKMVDSKKFYLLLICVCAGKFNTSIFYSIERMECLNVNSVSILGNDFELTVNNFVKIFSMIKSSGVGTVTISKDGTTINFIYS